MLRTAFIFIVVFLLNCELGHATGNLTPLKLYFPALLTAPLSCRSVRALFVRNEADEAPLIYLENQRQALLIFDLWLRGRHEGSFEAVLEKINRIALTGTTGTKFYTNGFYNTGTVPLGYKITGQDLQYRIKPMEMILKLIWDKQPKEVYADGIAEGRFFSLLFEYYNIALGDWASWDKLFEHGNNSIYMAQVNYLLEIYGYNGISHGTIDTAKDRRDAFMKAILEKNPGISIPERTFNSLDGVTQGVLRYWIEFPNLSAAEVASNIGCDLGITPKAEEIYRIWERIGLRLK